MGFLEGKGNPSEGRYRTLLARVSDMVTISDREGRIIYANPATAGVTGFTPEEFRALDPFELMHPEDRPRCEGAFEELVGNPGLSLRLEHRFRHKDGSWRWVEGTFEGLFEDPEVGGLVATVRDVTGRKRAEEALRESEERFRYMVRNSSDVLSLVEADGTIRYASPALGPLLGYAPEERVGGSIFDLLHPDDVERARGLFAEGLKNPGVPLKVEVRQRHRDGSWRTVEVTGTNLLSEPSAGAVVLNSRDVTERRRAEEALREAEERYRVLVDNMPPVAYVEGVGEGRPVYVSPRVEDLVGYPPERFVDDPDFWWGLVHPEDREKVLEENARANETGKPFGSEYRLIHRSGRVVWVRDEAVLVGAGKEGYWQGVMLDVTERKALEERLAHQALHDPLTGLPNRVLLADRLEHALVRLRRHGGSAAVLFMDLDNFKYVNDSLGHEEGDRLLAAVAERLAAALRPEDTAARLGGDEFAVLLEDVGEIGEAESVAGRIAERLGTPFALGGREVYVTPSIGIALGGAEDHPEALLRGADLAMYRAKEEGKARSRVFDPGMEARVTERLALENDLRRAIEREEFVVFYQPVVAAETGSIVGFEALVRWEHPERGLVSPYGFVPLAEEVGLIVPIGRWVLREACRRTKSWQEEARRSEARPASSAPPLAVGVNLSAKQLSYPGLIGEVEGALAESGLDPGRLTLEITESAVVGDEERHVHVLKGLENLGVRLAIDDFGTGYSSLSYLRRLPVSMLKIDRSFVREVGREGGAVEDEVLLSGVAGIAHGLGLRVLAEGVETPEQLERVRALGCDMAQGFLFSRPLPGDEAGALLTEGPITP